MESRKMVQMILSAKQKCIHKHRKKNVWTPKAAGWWDELGD